MGVTGKWKKGANLKPLGVGQGGVKKDLLASIHAEKMVYKPKRHEIAGG